MKRVFPFVVICTAILAVPLAAHTWARPAKLVVQAEAGPRVDEMLTSMADAGTFSGSVLIAQDGQVLLRKAYGLADRARQIPNTPETRFHLASMSKQFTAMAILLLESQGKLSVNDPICQHIVVCPVEWQDITIHHLLTHSSGLSRRLDDIMATAASDPATPPDPAYFIEITQKPPLDARPGERYAYSNFGYVLLAHIIEQVSGQSYAAFVERAIFTPLNMRSTGYEDKPGEGAMGYTDRDARTAAGYMSLPISNGSAQLYSTIEDLFLWDQGLNTEQLLPKTVLDRLFQQYSPEIDDVPGFGYGYGWLVGQDQGHPLVASAGSEGGFATLHVRYPEDGLTAIILMNQGDISHLSVWMAISGKLFGEPPATAAPGTPSAPRGRLMHHLAYDRESQQVIMFGGETGDRCQGVGVGSLDTLDDTWAWDVQTRSWTEMHPAVHPAGRGWGQMVYDAESDRVILFGGQDAALQPLDDVWAYDFNADSWEQLAGGPGARWLQSMVYDAESDRVVVIGGIREHGCIDAARRPDMLQDTWTYDYNSNTWTEIVSDEVSPLRETWQSAYSSKADRAFLLGSYNPKGRPRTWTYDLNAGTWSEIGTSSYVPDWRASMVYDSESDRFIVFPWEFESYTIVYDLKMGGETKMTLPSGATYPASRRNNSMVYVEDLDRVFLFSGYAERMRNYPTDIWLYDLNGNTWEKVGP